MIYLKEITRTPSAAEGFPFTIPSIATLTALRVTSPLVFLMGANATGKSTFLESLAIASNRVVVGGCDLKRDPSLDAIRPLARALKLGWAPRTGFDELVAEMTAADLVLAKREHAALGRGLKVYRPDLDNGG